MYQTLLDIFSSPSDQARLVTTIIAAIIAVAVVLINQWFNSKRARKEKIIGKIEETFVTSISMQEALSSFYSETIKNFDEYAKKKMGSPMFYSDKKKEEDIAQSKYLEVMLYGEKILMLSELYFPIIKEHIEIINKLHKEIYHNFVSADKRPNYQKSIEDNNSIIENEFSNISSKLTSKMNKTMH